MNLTITRRGAFLASKATAPEGSWFILNRTTRVVHIAPRGKLSASCSHSIRGMVSETASTGTKVCGRCFPEAVPA